MVAVVEEPLKMLWLAGVAEMLKSPTFTVIVAECVLPEPEPETVTTYVPGVVELNVQDAGAVPPLTRVTLGVHVT
jgi:hypothetical protein